MKSEARSLIGSAQGLWHSALFLPWRRSALRVSDFGLLSGFGNSEFGFQVQRN
jgi:hypothetical protein